MHVDVFHDTACPWCRIGKRYLDEALARWAGPTPTVRWRPFLLAPDIPPAGLPFRDYMGVRKGGAEGLDPLFALVTRAGAAAGLTFRFDRVEVAPNTLLSHVLIALAPAERQSAVVDEIERAYFEEGRNIGESAVLTDLAAGVGFDPVAVADGLGSKTAQDAVRAEADKARRLGVSGVPLFLVAGAVALSGAQSTAELLRAFEQAAAQPLAQP